MIIRAASIPPHQRNCVKVPACHAADGVATEAPTQSDSFTGGSGWQRNYRRDISIRIAAPGGPSGEGIAVAIGNTLIVAVGYERASGGKNINEWTIIGRDFQGA